jgi:hypothetical protein
VAPPVPVAEDAVLELVDVVLPFTDIVLVLMPVELDGELEVLDPGDTPELPSALIVVQTALVLGDFWLYGR